MRLERVTAKGQIKMGDILLIKVFPEIGEAFRALEIKLCDGREEVILTRYSNKYFVTDMLLAGDSWAKDVRIVRFEDESEERGLVCVFCGEGFGYAGDTPDEATLKAAVDHEKECLNNPYKAEIRYLRSVLKEANDYLHTNNMTYIASGSILHGKFMSVLGDTQNGR